MDLYSIIIIFLRWFPGCVFVVFSVIHGILVVGRGDTSHTRSFGTKEGRDPGFPTPPSPTVNRKIVITLYVVFRQTNLRGAQAGPTWPLPSRFSTSHRWRDRLDLAKDSRDFSDSWASPPIPPRALFIVSDDIPGTAPVAEGSWAGRRHPPYSTALSLVSGGGARPFVAQSRALNITLLLLLLLCSLISFRSLCLCHNTHPLAVAVARVGVKSRMAAAVSWNGYSPSPSSPPPMIPCTDWCR